MMLFFAFVYCFVSIGVFDFTSLTAYERELPAAIQLCFILAAASKSAQLGFTGWLLSAMEGPTPVSALMHAATLVTAGVILLIKLGSSFSGWALVVVFVVGSCTAIFSGLGACFECD
jgi:NADH:ubiquinone oxidoreductase subunit 5 (subunit L)/multisubunit Na+/H+ antiporter MnhA subunit